MNETERNNRVAATLRLIADMIDGGEISDDPVDLPSVDDLPALTHGGAPLNVRFDSDEEIHVIQVRSEIIKNEL